MGARWEERRTPLEWILVRRRARINSGEKARDIEEVVEEVVGE